MPDGPPVLVANAIAHDLRVAVDGGEEFEVRFDPEVVWGKRDVALEQANELKVTIALLWWTHTLSGRGNWVWTCRYHVGVRKRYEVTETTPQTGEIADEDVKKLANLLNDLVNFFTPKQSQNAEDVQDGRLSQVPEAVWVSDDDNTKDLNTNVRIEWPTAHNLRQFTGWFLLTYEVSD